MRLDYSAAQLLNGFCLVTVYLARDSIGIFHDEFKILSSKTLSKLDLWHVGTLSLVAGSSTYSIPNLHSISPQYASASVSKSATMLSYTPAALSNSQAARRRLARSNSFIFFVVSIRNSLFRSAVFALGNGRTLFNPEVATAHFTFYNCHNVLLLCAIKNNCVDLRNYVNYNVYFFH